MRIEDRSRREEHEECVDFTNRKLLDQKMHQQNQTSKCTTNRPIFDMHARSNSLNFIKWTIVVSFIKLTN